MKSDTQKEVLNFMGNCAIPKKCEVMVCGNDFGIQDKAPQIKQLSDKLQLSLQKEGVVANISGGTLPIVLDCKGER